MPRTRGLSLASITRGWERGTIAHVVGVMFSVGYFLLTVVYETLRSNGYEVEQK